ncbi:hypothetical protein DXG03_000497 [Asterophora parasitica]|uniref:Protein N-terminal and lysine N-methyltransferase EFM7 n=1 Tax=Asterophora parasitica TaxID=117018 RepID=A0A9P7KDA5_9AGAR|nr:hypothetical protein DXG03_000497 [Asterophora parasitica]
MGKLPVRALSTDIRAELKWNVTHRWNAARAFATYLDESQELYRDKNVLELGAGGALPSIVAAQNGARKVLITDYPDDDLIKNIDFNVTQNISCPVIRENVSVQGYIWGRPIDALVNTLPDTHLRFDLIILSDLIFNHSQHDALLSTCEAALTTANNTQDQDTATPPSVLVFYSHHRPHLAHRDMEFFEQARGRGWHAEEILTRKFTPMFPNDSGEESVRSTVHGWRLTRP